MLISSISSRCGAGRSVLSASTRFKRVLLGSAASAMLAIHCAPLAMAADGDGGKGPVDTGAGGSSVLNAAGNAGQSGIQNRGGSGGGSGVTGGAGGIGGGGTLGGAGGASPGADGQNGGNAASGSNGAGGGGGGAHGYVGAITGLGSGAIRGGNGGNSGTGGGYGGGGGGGGVGAVVSGISGATTTISGGRTITGGNGGNAGWAAAGGSAGSGLVLRDMTGTNSLTINAALAGGNGGSGQASGASGAGGTGLVISGGDGTNSLTINGAVTGGQGAANATSASNIGGVGGAGIRVAGGTATTLTINAAITGGNALSTNVAGAGIAGDNLTVILGASANVSGGVNSAGTRAAAIAFGTGQNVLEWRQGATLTGAVTGLGSDDQFRLGGTVDGSFAVDTLQSRFGSVGAVVKAGSATWTVTGTNASSAAWTISEGRLSLATGASISSARSVTVNSILDVSATTATTIRNLSGTNAGAQVVVGNSTLTIAQQDSNPYLGSFTGTGTISKTGTGKLILLGDSSAFTGTVTVDGGALQIGQGSAAVLGGDVTVNAGGTLTGGGGSIGGALSVASGGTLVGSQNGGEITAGSLVLNAGAVTTAWLSDTTASALFVSTGNMTVNGTVNVNGQPGYGIGVYRLFASGGTLTDNGLTLGSAPTGAFGTTLDVRANAVDLVVQGYDTSLQYWRGGSNWTSTTQWDNGTSGTQAAWGSNTGVFGGTGTSVAVTGTQAFDTLEFLNSGYTLTGTAGGLDLGTGGRLWAEGANTVAEVDASISGTGALTKIGAGTIILGGTNSYAGGTILSAGTLSVSADGNLGDAAGGVTFDGGTLAVSDSFATARSMTLTGNGNVAVAAGTSFTIDGVIAGAGRLSTAGDGTVVLTGANSYTGGTAISGGQLSVAADAALGATSGGISLAGGRLQATASFSSNRAVTLDAAQATVGVAQGSVLTLAGTISGNGMLSKADLGTLVLTGANSYVGGTTIAAGTVSVASNASLGASTGTVTLAGGTLQATGSFTSSRNIALTAAEGHVAVSASQSLTLSGTISGSGTLVKDDLGTLILTGDNSYTGGTRIVAGTLQIGNGGTTGSILGDVVNDGTLIFDRSGSYSFPGTITGSGAVLFRGGGAISFDGNSGFTGTVTVQESDLKLVNGSSTASSFTVEQGGAIFGNATIGGLIVRNGGRAAPGNSPGTIAVNGNVLFEAGSIYVADITADGQHDQINATGTATIRGGTVQMIAAAGQYGPRGTYTILSAANGVTGRFDSVTSNLAFLTPSLSYSADAVSLSFVRNDISFASKAVTSNQRAVAGGAEALGAGVVYDAILGLTDGTAPAAFDALSGEVFPTAATLVIDQSSNLRAAVGTRRAKPGDATGTAPSLWGTGFGSWATGDATGNTARITQSVGGLFIGADAKITDNWRLGFIGGYGRTTLNVAARAASGSIDSYHLGLYADGRIGALGLQAGVSHSWNDARVNRTAAFGTLRSDERASYAMRTTQVFGEAGYTVDAGALQAEPFAGIAYVHLPSYDLKELGGAASLAGRGRVQDTAFSTVGLRLSGRVAVGGVVVLPRLSAAWQHSFGDTVSVTHFRFADAASEFDVHGMPLSRNAAMVDAGLDIAMSRNIRLSVSYAGQLFSTIQNNSVRGGVSIRF